MLQSVSAHLMDERRGSTRERDRRRSTYGHSAGSPSHPQHTTLNFLVPPTWVGTQIVEEYRPLQIEPAENPIGWAIFNPLPIRPPPPRPRIRAIQITEAVIGLLSNFFASTGAVKYRNRTPARMFLRKFWNQWTLEENARRMTITVLPSGTKKVHLKEPNELAELYPDRANDKGWTQSLML
ncbi:unnamed protein product [Caenorhabditis bovis]|uniref:Uncharacterized protein n=1 Tax=Caenorhabditis bovis TaxID=2654633 RepID=A0A8S1F8M1_9PELO|nr:unnamed protein product [Caenorhabditis bovis]